MSIIGAKTYKAQLGTDEAGAVIRIDNAIGRIGQELEGARQTLQDTRNQIANAEAELAKPFEREAELSDKSMRLAELDRLLNIDKPDQTQLCSDKHESRRVEAARER